MFSSESKMEAREIAPGVTRKILTYNDELMVCEFKLKKGSGVPEHHHEHIQNTYIVSGKLKMEMEGNARECSAGEAILMGRNVPHKVTALEDSWVVDSFTPARKDFL
ncbi:MAG: cupin domain-containing protein [Lachnospiraceae bacterium]|nr:cupin domain-containing protein [Lachnospiraceae bacterium]